MKTTAKLINDLKTAAKDGGIPDFLKRTETPEQAEKRRAKQAPKNDSKGLSVVTPPDPKISAAIAKDFAEKGQKAQAAVDDLLAKRDAAITKTAARALKKPDAVAKINAARAEAGMRPYDPNRGKSDAARARRAAAKDPVLSKALRERDELAARAKAAAEKAKSKSAPKSKSAEKKPAKSASKKFTPRDGSIAAKMFTEAKIDTARKLIARKGGALSSEIQKACGWKPIIVRRFVRDVARKKLGMSVICDRSTGHDSTYKL